MCISKNPVVLVFRKPILPYSETFIAEQGRHIRGFNVIYCGFKHDNTGIALLNSEEKYVLSDYSHFVALAKLHHRLGLVANKAWLHRIRDQNPRLIHAHFVDDGHDAILLGRKLDVPVITTVHGRDITKHCGTFLCRGKRKKVFNCSSRIIAVSDYIKNTLIANGCPEHKIYQHYIGVDTEKFSGKKCEFPEPSILFVGRLVEKKGVRYLLEAINMLGNAHRNTRLNIVGSGRLEGQLRQMSGRYRLNVHFLGKKTPVQIKQLMLESWLFAAPSVTADNGDTEGLGMVFLEAQSLKTPVVAFRSGGVVEAVDDGKSGFLCEEQNAACLAEHIKMLIDDAEQRKRFGEHGRKYVLEKFNIVSQSLKLALIYREVIQSYR